MKKLLSPRGDTIHRIAATAVMLSMATAYVCIRAPWKNVPRQNAPQILAEHIRDGRMNPRCMSSEAARDAVAEALGGQKAGDFQKASRKIAGAYERRLAASQDAEGRREAATEVASQSYSIFMAIEKNRRGPRGVAWDAIMGERFSEYLTRRSNALLGLEAVDRACTKD